MQVNLVKSALPSATVSSLRGGGVPRSTTVFGFHLAFANRGENVLM